MMYQFNLNKRSGKTKPNKGHNVKPVSNEEPPMQTIQGMAPGSVQEWRVALALNRLKLDYEYQKSIGGGRRVRGGQVIDFWIYTAPYPTPCFVQGEYWHNRKTEAEDTLKQERVQRIYKGQVMPNLILLERDLSSADAAYTLLRRKLIG